MLVYRFMSRAEYDKYQSGAVLVSKIQHRRNRRTESVGFCFMAVEDYAPSEAYKFLRGIVSDQMLCVFEIEDLEKSSLRESCGTYAVPYSWALEAGDECSYGMSFKAWELCTKAYSKETLKLVYAKRVPESWRNLW